ncbi:MAG: cytochrome d ubiquinol oxidase subunit II, partial [Rhodospirillaceae bacterium]
ILPALYIPLILMLVALIFRGVAFEFRFKTVRGRPWWDAAFVGGSVTATFVQGIALGSFIQGFEVSGRAFVGGPFDWLTPFALFTGAALVAGYAALGCGWLILKTEGELQDRLWRLMLPLAGGVLASVAVVSLWTPLIHDQIAQRWFSWPNIAVLSPVPVAVGIVALLLVRAVRARRDRQPFVLTMALFVLGYAGLGISLWPHVVPPSITLWDAAAPPESQGFLLIGVAPLIPVILAYTAYSYRVFRGKVRHGEGYH